MGGFGSGRRGGLQATTVEEVKSIDLAYLRRKGLLEPGTYSWLHWSLGGEPSGSIRFAVEADAIRLMYRFCEWDDEWQDVDERVRLAWTYPNLGGQRAWFICPSCWRRCRVLHGGAYFRCRCCHGYRYESQYEPPYQRAISQAQKIRMRLGGSGNMAEPFPDKPKGMHWRTYERHLRRDEELETLGNILVMRRFGIDL